MSSRAPALPAQERRAQLEDAAVRVLLQRGLAATTKEIAAEAGVAEGTIFGVFESKDELVHAALCRAFDPMPYLARLDQIDRSLGLRERLVELVTILQERLVDLFDLMNAVGMIRPPEDLRDRPETRAARARVDHLMVEIVQPDTARLSVSVEHLVRLLRLLTFAGSNAHIAHGELLSPRQIVDALLDGALHTPTEQDTPC